jgi:hypothetical protein
MCCLVPQACTVTSLTPVYLPEKHSIRLDNLQPALVRHHLRPGNTFPATCSRLTTANKPQRRAAEVAFFLAAAAGTMGSCAHLPLADVRLPRISASSDDTNAVNCCFLHSLCLMVKAPWHMSGFTAACRSGLVQPFSPAQPLLFWWRCSSGNMLYLL